MFAKRIELDSMICVKSVISFDIAIPNGADETMTIVRPAGPD